MNREIKFRAWDSIGNQMIQPEDLIMLCGNTSKEINQRFTLQQYTGLKDKNGKEIYEGDIIGYTQHLFNWSKEFPKEEKVVKWNSSEGKWNVFETNAGESDIEVIGNIYENPELLSQPNTQ